MTSFIQLVFASLLLWGAIAWPAQAQVHRCVNAMGEMVYTDRRCEDVGATERLAPAATLGRQSQLRGVCSRRLRDLVTTVQLAVDSKDANMLASVYDWTGMSTSGGYALMERLEQIAQRPLLDILPIYPRPAPILAADGSVVDDNLDGYYPQATRRTPTGLQLLQTFSNGHTASRTVFGLRKKMGCWWVRM